MRAIEQLRYSYNEENIITKPEAKITLLVIYAVVNEIVNKDYDSVVVFP